MREKGLFSFSCSEVLSSPLSQLHKSWWQSPMVPLWNTHPERLCRDPGIACFLVLPSSICIFSLYLADSGGEYCNHTVQLGEESLNALQEVCFPNTTESRHGSLPASLSFITIEYLVRYAVWSSYIKALHIGIYTWVTPLADIYTQVEIRVHGGSHWRIIPVARGTAPVQATTILCLGMNTTKRFCTQLRGFVHMFMLQAETKYLVSYFFLEWLYHSSRKGLLK